MNQPAIGFIGFGEAGFHIAKGLRDAGIIRICAYDINTHAPGLGARIQQRAKESEINLRRGKKLRKANDHDGNNSR